MYTYTGSLGSVVLLSRRQVIFHDAHAIDELLGSSPLAMCTSLSLYIYIYIVIIIIIIIVSVIIIARVVAPSRDARDREAIMLLQHAVKHSELNRTTNYNMQVLLHHGVEEDMVRNDSECCKEPRCYVR